MGNIAPTQGKVKVFYLWSRDMFVKIPANELEKILGKYNIKCPNMARPDLGSMRKIVRRIKRTIYDRDTDSNRH